MLIKYAKYTALHVLSSTGHGFKSCHCSKNRSLVRLSVVCGILSKVRGFAVKISCIIKGCMRRPSEKWDNSVLIIYQLLPIVTVIFDYQFVCVSLGVFFLRFSSNAKTSYTCGEKDTNLNLILIAIEQWGFSKVPHLRRHGSTFYIGDLRGPVTLTHNTKGLAVELSLPVLTTLVCPDRVSNPDLPHARRFWYFHSVQITACEDITLKTGISRLKM